MKHTLALAGLFAVSGLTAMGHVQAEPSIPSPGQDLVHRQFTAAEYALADVEKSLHRKAEANPKDAKAYAEWAGILTTMGRFDEAIAAYRKTIELDRGYKYAHYNLGHILLEQKKYDEAIVAFNIALEQESFKAANTELGLALTAQSRLNEALNAFREAARWGTQSEDVNAEAYCDLGRSLIDLGRLNEAIAAFRQAVKLNAEYAPAHIGISLVLASQNHTIAAIKVLNKTLEWEDYDFLEAYGDDFYSDYLKLGQALVKRDRPKEALLAFRKVLQPINTSARTEAMYEIGNLFLAQNKLELANKMFHTVILYNLGGGTIMLAWEPDSFIVAKAFNGLGIVAMKQHRFKDAISSFNRALGYDPNNLEFQHNLEVVKAFSTQLQP
jgi:tetratricopeptide (TPR) repeat protein